ncbi:MAG: 7-carboxy-7-deazaguanine synthase QueE, partial [Pseudomonadota bacterium]
RLTGCPLRCQYCDTAYAFTGGKALSVDAVLDRVAELSASQVCVTGGEPLAQPACIALLTRLCDAGYAVSLETSGALDTSKVDARVSVVLDLKTPASGEAHRNLWDNVKRLRPHDQVKFVVCDRADFEWAVAAVERENLLSRCTVLVSPSYEQVQPQELAGWVLKSGLNLRLQLQLHKLLWGDRPGV